MTELATAPPSNYESGPCVGFLFTSTVPTTLPALQKEGTPLPLSAESFRIDSDPCECHFVFTLSCRLTNMLPMSHSLKDFPRVPLSSVTPAVYLQSLMPLSERRVNSVTILLKDDYSSTSRLMIHKHDILTPSEKYFLA